MQKWWRELGEPGQVLLVAFGLVVVSVALISAQLRKMVDEQRAAKAQRSSIGR